ncbi:hypothetical protein TNCV_5137851 [Trichonephila clavipes]|nr:hypothetical protein TNCV_5137851 [Trichonephila clavipes]
MIIQESRSISVLITMQELDLFKLSVMLCFKLSVSDAEAVGHNTQEDYKFEKSYKHSASLDRLIQKLMDEEKEIVLWKQQKKLRNVKK